MKYSGLIFLLFIFTLTAFSQSQISVINAKNGQPVEGAILVSKSSSTQTNEMGVANLGIFLPDETIHLKHASFLNVTTSRARIEKQGNVVLLIENPIKLDEIVVSVNRWEESKSEIPHLIETINPETVQKYTPQTTADLLGTKVGIFIQKSQMGGGSPMIRGFAANRVLIVVDGIRMNNAIYRSGNLQNVISVDANSLENTEVIFGPGSVIYGSDALGGVMSFNTLSPKLSTGENAASFGKVYSRLSSANLEKSIHASYNFGGKKWAAVFSSTYAHFNDLRMGSSGPEEYLRPDYVSNEKYSGEDKIIQNKNPNIQRYTAYNQINVLGKVRYRPNEKWDLILGINHSETGNIPRYDRLIQYNDDQLKYAEWYYGPQNWSLLSGKMQYSNNHMLFDRMNLLLGYQNYTESRHDRKLNNDWLHHRNENLNVYSFNVDFGKQFTKNTELFYGIEGYLNNVESNGKSENLLSKETEEIASRYPDGSEYKSIAAYYSFKYEVSPKLIFQLGSRYTITNLNGSFDPDFYSFPFDGFDMTNAAFNGNLGVVWHPTPDWQINVHASTGFRSPNIDDVAKVFDSEPGTVIVPNPDLEPEYARNFEINILRNINNLAKFEITGFYTLLKDAMVRRDYTLNGQDSILYDGEMSKVEALVNAESATIYGINFNAEILFTQNWRMRHDLSLTYGKDSEDFPLRHVPPAFGSSHFIYENQRFFADFYINYNGKLTFNELSPDEQDKPHLYVPDKNGNLYSPSWWTLNVKSNYKLTQKLTMSAGIENILDKRYRSYSSGVVSPGINFIISASLKI